MDERLGDEAPLPLDDAQIDVTADDIEAAYERALMAVEAAEVATPALLVESNQLQVVDDESDSLFDDESSDLAAHSNLDTQPSPETDHLDETEEQEAEPSAPVLHPREIIEAALFVGGQSLTTKRLAQMLGGIDAADRVDRHIEELNAIYAAESRPYQIDFGEGGYRLVLHAEYEPVRRAVFGAGPKEVKLSQEALEVLAFVAYRQPATKADLVEAGREKPTGMLNQLLRRELITLERDGDGEVCYSTSPRFLDLFSLRSLDDLPFPEDLELK